MTNINRVLLTGNLTKDPELRDLPSSVQVCQLRLAVNTRRKNASTGEWEEEPNYFDVNVFGAQGETCHRYLEKGRAVAIDGRLRWREYLAKDGQKRQAVCVVADTVQFLGSANSQASSSTADTVSGGQSSDRQEPSPEPAGVGLDDIPF